jgi:hypothetical protein
LSPSLSDADRTKVERVVTQCEGVVSSSCVRQANSFVMTVQYDASTVRYQQILDMAKRHDPAADLTPVLNRRRLSPADIRARGLSTVRF